MSTLDAIVEDLRTLPPPKLAEAALLIRGLKGVSRADRLAALERSSKILTPEQGAELERIVCGEHTNRDLSDRRPPSSVRQG